MSAAATNISPLNPLGRPGSTGSPPSGRPPGARCVAGRHLGALPPAGGHRAGSSTLLLTRSWAMPTRPLCPVKPLPRPAAWARACTRRPICLEESPKTGCVPVKELLRGPDGPQSLRCLPADVEDHALALRVGLGPADCRSAEPLSRSSTSAQVRAVASERRISPSRGLPGWRRHAGRDSSQRHLAVWALDRQSMDCFPWFRSEVGFASFQAAPREPLMQTEPASAEGVQQTLDAIIERFLLLHRVIEHLAKAGEGGQSPVFKNARFLNTFRREDAGPRWRLDSHDPAPRHLWLRPGQQVRRRGQELGDPLRLLADHGIREDLIFPDIATGRTLRRAGWQELMSPSPARRYPGGGLPGPVEPELRGWGAHPG